MKKIVVIEADSYREEVKVLMKDPIVIQMAAGLSKAGVKFDQSKGMIAAMKEYERQGGKKQRSIGGVGKAIIALQESDKYNPSMYHRGGI